ncbi:type II CAAX prenyl endopeptidase Rce1 family protein [Roseivirga sp.]|uniref:CPBP family glutamic-type intramembrane protease n=1 Tax=Roseivirga sp. TaxID=1964215 RepID=UPI003BA941F0
MFTSELFGYMHDYQGITGQVLTGYTGFSMGLVYLWKRNIWLNIFIHGAIDTISMFLLYKGLYIA